MPRPCKPFAFRQLALARLPAALALDPIETFRQAVRLHHEVVLRERRRRQQVGAANGERIESEIARHLVEQALECETHIDGAVAAERAAWRRVGQHPLAEIFHVAEVVDRVQHRAGIEDGDDAVAGMRAAALDAFAFDAADAAVLFHADLEPDVGFRPAAMGDEGLLAVDHEAHAAAGLARQQRRDQFDIERLGAAAEAAADMRLDHADARHVHVEDLRQHQVHVIRHLRRSMHGDAVAHRVVVGDRRVHLHLVLADLGAIIGALAHQVGAGKGGRDVAQLEQHVALDIVRAIIVDGDSARRQRFGGGVVGGQLAHFQLDPPQRLFRRRIVDRSDRGDRLAAIADAVARQGMLGARDRQHAECLIAIGAGDDRLHAGKFRGFRNIDVEDFGMRIGTAKDPPRQHVPAQ